MSGLIAAPLAAQQGPDAPRPIPFEALDQLAGISGAALSPDGRRVAFVERGRVFVMGLAPRGEARELGPGSNPVWAADGERLLVVASPASGGPPQLHMVRPATLERRQLTSLEGGVIPDRIAWSGTGKLLFTAMAKTEAPAAVTPPPPTPADARTGRPLVLGKDAPDGYALAGLVTGFRPVPNRLPPVVPQVFVHDLAAAETAQLTRDPAGYHSPDWSPDGRWIVAGTGRGLGRNVLSSALRLVDPRTGGSRELVPAGDTAKFSPRWSPRGNALAYTFHSFADAREHGIAVVGVDGAGAAGPPRTLHRGHVEDVSWTADGHAVLTTETTGVVRPVLRVDAGTGEATVLGCAGAVAMGQVSAAGTAVAWVESTGARPALLKVRDGDGPERTLRDPNPQIAGWSLGAQEVVRWRSRHGHRRQGVLIAPAGCKPGVRYPLVVSAYTQTTHLNSFQAFTHGGFASQAYASRGYAVFFPGPRVPWNYGSLAADAQEKAALMGPGGWDIAVDDVESGVDVLIARGLVDPERMAIVGHSNGGAVATAVLTRTQRYRAVVAVAPANINWVQLALFADDRAGRWIPPATFTGIGEEIWTDPRPWVAGSPVLHLADAKTPTLLAIGDKDDHSFTIPTVELYLGLRRLGRDVTLLRYEGIGHGFYGPAGDDLRDRVLAFVQQRLAPR